MAIELHLCKGGDFRTTTDFLECGNCFAIIPNQIRVGGLVTCGTCGSEYEPDELPDARVEEIIERLKGVSKLEMQIAQLRSALKKAQSGLESASQYFDKDDSPGVVRSVERAMLAVSSTLEATK